MYYLSFDFRGRALMDVSYAAPGVLYTQRSITVGPTICATRARWEEGGGDIVLGGTVGPNTWAFDYGPSRLHC